MSRFAPRSAAIQVDAKNPAPMLDLVQQDLRQIARVVNAAKPTYLTAPSKVAIPVAGKCDVYLLTDTATATSTGVNYHTIVATRSGRAEGAVSIDTRNREMSAYKQLFCGTFQVGAGDIMSYTLTVGGVPVPTLTASNLTMLCVLTPTEVNK